MEKLARNVTKVLPEFQEFLAEKELVTEKNVQFYAYWVNKFIS